jgi:hypothetical protein
MGGWGSEANPGQGKKEIGRKKGRKEGEKERNPT